MRWIPRALELAIFGATFTPRALLRNGANNGSLRVTLSVDVCITAQPPL